MEKVSTIDIQGEQWAITDQEATERLNKLETKTTVKRTDLWRQGNSYIEMVEYNDLVFYKGSFKDDIKISFIGEEIFKINTGKQKNEIVQVYLAGDKTDKTGRVPILLNIFKDGKVQAYPITENTFSGTYAECTIFGDFFQLVN